MNRKILSLVVLLAVGQLVTTSLEAATPINLYQGVWSSTATYQAGNTVTYNNQTFLSLVSRNQAVTPGAAGSTAFWQLLGANIAGPQGPAGPTGAQGPQGPMGLTGAQGPIGPIGLTGAQGLPGAKGDTGATGPAGPTGPTGPAGPQGPTGLTGATGPAGTQVFKYGFYVSHSLSYGDYPDLGNNLLFGNVNLNVGNAYNPTTGILTVVAVLDNLIKGAAGQAVQNMNQLFGFEETAGLLNLPTFI